MYVWHFYQKVHTELHSGLHYYAYVTGFLDKHNFWA